MSVNAERSRRESRGVKLVATFALLPVLCMAFVDIGGRVSDIDWLTRDFVAWPLMLAPVGFLFVFVTYRESTFNSPNGTHLNQTTKVFSGMYLVLNLITALAYSWLAVFSVLICLSILVTGPILKRRAPR